MDPYATLDFPNGRIAFIGTVRCDDVGVKEFRVELPNRAPMYGAWRACFAENGNDFNIEIVTFGYGDKLNVGNPHPKARVRFTVEETTIVEELVHELFANRNLTAGLSPFSMKLARFLGGVKFLPRWISQADE